MYILSRKRKENYEKVLKRSRFIFSPRLAKIYAARAKEWRAFTSEAFLFRNSGVLFSRSKKAIIDES